MFVLVNGLRINYEENGSEKSGESLVLLHGWKNDLEIWQSITPFLANYHLIKLDLPGFGRSDFMPEAWNVSDYAKLLNNFFEKLGISKATLIGHSFGGRIAVKFGVLYPNKVSKLVLIDAGGVRLKSFKKFAALILAKLGKIIWLIPPIRLKKDELRRKFYESIKANDYLEPNPILKKTLLKIIEEDLRNDAKKINSPTLIIWGEKDLITSRKEGLLLADSVKNSRLIFIKDAGHWPFAEKTREFVKILIDSLLKMDNPIKASTEEFERVKRLSELERNWWRNLPAYKTAEDIIRDAESGFLKKIESDENLKLIMRFENSDLKEWPPYLSKETAALLKEVGRRWRKKAARKEISEEVRLAVTSLMRTIEYQKELMAKGKLAMPESPHTKGQCFDIDGYGYYNSGKAINPRQTADYQNIYNSNVHEALKETLEEMKAENCLNYILEYEGTNNQCFHIARSPDYQPMQHA